MSLLHGTTLGSRVGPTKSNMFETSDPSCDCSLDEAFTRGDRRGQIDQPDRVNAQLL